MSPEAGAAETPLAQPEAPLAIRSEANVQPPATFRRPPAPGVVTVAAGTQGLEAAAAPPAAADDGGILDALSLSRVLPPAL